jgi:prefoldin subunit 5
MKRLKAAKSKLEASLAKVNKAIEKLSGEINDQ